MSKKTEVMNILASEYMCDQISIIYHILMTLKKTLKLKTN